ncbi:hypothetical protein GFS31_24160 [Leptolyngbya sp. BL0902]|uniref:hypothetical protein n=1 Tax=Leptolyngbya sp. BL0902 TaxID=1115757 RepID=UPI0018E8E247|nr:hypothetical protein [Leptolyngbya sp. BL0902]QQE65728.1 hypothetical protein GFS31_24160 [Leptolyngbya sp. BL0902]
MAAAINSTATSAEAQAIEVASALNALERAQSTDLEPLNNVQVDLDAENGLLSITMTLPVTVTATATGFAVAAVPYLT